MSTDFVAAFAKGDPASLAQRCLEQLPAQSNANLGILYVSEPAAVRFSQIAGELVAGTGIANWVGGVGLGLCAGGEEVYERPAAAVLTASLPDDKFRLFGPTDDPAADLPRAHAQWIQTEQPSLALVHADPRCRDLVRITLETGMATGAFLVGGLVSHRCATPLLARAAGSEGEGFGTAGIGGLMLSPDVAVATALTQGCMPIGPVRRIDEARDNVVMAIDGRPALSVLKDDIGPALAEDMRKLGNVIFAGLPVAGSDTGDYLVRNLLAIDPGNNWIVLGAEVQSGDQILFCRRDPDSARTDMARMLGQLARRLPGPPKAGIYVSCVARGVSLFDEPGVEAAMIRDTFGDIPLVGFFANGEISRDRLYGHTGVLTLFT
jgi:small ligand-binding sensory domain FIST